MEIKRRFVSPETSKIRNLLHPNISCVLCVGSKMNVNITLAANHHFFYCHIKANNVINLLTNREKTLHTSANVSLCNHPFSYCHLKAHHFLKFNY